ncbi:bifunctional metallophosphatase/5'-nucleotidase [Azonexus sp. IMCC34842]|uniref:bifunctional metallophosphatase/5'-nucleotidase n=1 Tax=Azonexus sp. IMCC34842 TaxID=3420950 RepID=UPI003D0C16AA
MTSRSLTHLLGSLFLTALLLASATGFAQPTGMIQVGLIHVNDIYQIAPIDPQAPRGGLARLASLVKAIRQQDPATLFVFGGDTLSPSVESGLFKGRQMMAAWNALGVDVAVPGNHEFDFGESVLRDRLAESRFPWLAANLLAEPPLPAIKPSELRVINGVRVGLLGLLTPDTATLSKPGPNIRFAELLAAAAREVAALRSQGAEVIVGLTHCTLAEDRQLAASGLFDLILGGHDHHLVTEQVGRTPIFKAGSDARDAIHIRLRFASDRTGHHLASMAWDILPLDGRQVEDPAVLSLATEFEQQVSQLLGEPIAETAVALDARGETMRRSESNIGNFAADAVREAMHSDIALLNGGGFRSDRLLSPGPLTRRDILALLPFENPLVLLSITGAQLREVLEHELDRRVAKGQSGALPHIGGMRLSYAPKQPKGQRIIELQIAGEPVQADKSYTLATSSYLAEGGDGYLLLKQLPVLRPAEGSPSDTEVLIQAMQRVRHLAPSLDGRLKVAP